jgi:hypothetical protein
MGKSLVGKSDQNSAEIHNYSDSGPFPHGILIGISPIWNMFPPFWNSSPPLILPISYTRKGYHNFLLYQKARLNVR